MRISTAGKSARRSSRSPRGFSGRSAPRRRSAGVTLLELLAALAVMALMLTLARPAVDGVSTIWRLRAAAHEIETTVRLAQNLAAVEGAPVQVLYDVPDGSYWVRTGKKTHGLRRLPGGVAFEAVRFGEIEVVSDVAAPGAYPDGTVDAHEVVLAAAPDLRIRLTFQRLTGEPVSEELTDAAH